MKENQSNLQRVHYRLALFWFRNDTHCQDENLDFVQTGLKIFHPSRKKQFLEELKRYFELV